MSETATEQKIANLILFAHKGEANETLSFLSAKVVTISHLPWIKLYQASNCHFENKSKIEKHYFILLTGEGPFAVDMTLPTCLFYLLQNDYKLELIINLGIVGSLNQSLHHLDMLLIDTVYLCHAVNERTCHMEFRSFQSQGQFFNLIKGSEFPLKRVNTVTVQERIHSPQLAQKLSTFAHVVDRELWSVAYSAWRFNLEWISLKLVFDCPLIDSDTPLINNENKAELSKELLKTLKLFLSLSSTSFSTNDNIAFGQDTLDKDLFHFTFQQKERWEQMIHHIPNTVFQNYSKEILPSILSENLNKKERTKKLLASLEDFLNPLNKKIKDQFQEYLSSTLEKFDNSKINIEEINNFEEYKITLNINGQEELNKMIEYLKTIDLEKFEQEICSKKF